MVGIDQPRLGKVLLLQEPIDRLPIDQLNALPDSSASTSEAIDAPAAADGPSTITAHLGTHGSADAIEQMADIATAPTNKPRPKKRHAAHAKSPHSCTSEPLGW